MKGQDIVILIKLASLEDDDVSGGNLGWSHQKLGVYNHSVKKDRVGPMGDKSLVHEADIFSLRSLENVLDISKSEISNSLRRSIESGLAIDNHHTGRPSPNRRGLRDFIVHGLKYVFPVKAMQMTRGMPTAFGAPILQNLVQSAGNLLYVWPDFESSDMGLSIEPLFKTVPEACRYDNYLYGCLALVDAIRTGNPRESNIAIDAIDRVLLH